MPEIDWPLPFLRYGIAPDNGVRHDLLPLSLSQALTASPDALAHALTAGGFDCRGGFVFRLADLVEVAANCLQGKAFTINLIDRAEA